MLIDWFTVCAQAINFLILVWLLRRFLYKPILDAIDVREKKVAAELADADTKKTEAETERQEFQKKNEEFDSGRSALIARTTKEAEAERKRLLDEARKEADESRTKWQEALKTEQQTLIEEIASKTRREVFAIARKTLTDLAGTNLEERMLDVFAERLRSLKGKQKEKLLKAFQPGPAEPVVRSAFALSAPQQAAIQAVIEETLAVPSPLRFETAPEQVSGIEITSNGHKISWSIAEYLQSLEEDVNEVIQSQTKPEPVSP